MGDLTRMADCHASGTVRPAFYAVKGMNDLRLCGHCTTQLAPELVRQGWTLDPITHRPGVGVGTEATPAHFGGGL